MDKHKILRAIPKMNVGGTQKNILEDKKIDEYTQGFTYEE